MDALLNTTEAAKLVGRSVASIRCAIFDGRIPRADRSEMGRPLVKRSDLLAWAAKAPPPPPTASVAADRTADALAALGSSEPAALAEYLGIHPGNVRKHLAQLARLGRARRDTQGLWVLTDEAEGAA